jgi:hypothetical protein
VAFQCCFMSRKTNQGSLEVYWQQVMGGKLKGDAKNISTSKHLHGVLYIFEANVQKNVSRTRRCAKLSAILNAHLWELRSCSTSMLAASLFLSRFWTSCRLSSYGQPIKEISCTRCFNVRPILLPLRPTPCECFPLNTPTSCSHPSLSKPRQLH